MHFFADIISYGLSSHFLNSVFHKAKVQLTVFMDSLFMFYLKQKKSPTQNQGVELKIAKLETEDQNTLLSP